MKLEDFLLRCFLLCNRLFNYVPKLILLSFVWACFLQLSSFILIDLFVLQAVSLRLCINFCRN